MSNGGVGYSQSNGVLNSGAGFNGSGQCLYTNTSADFDFYGSMPFTMSTWVRFGSYLTSNNTYQMIIIQFDGTNPYATSIYICHGKDSNGVNTINFTPFNYSLNKWYHLVKTYTSDGYYSFYIDGKQISSAYYATLNTANPSTPKLSLGASTSTSQWKYFNGAQDEVKFDNNGWSQAMVKNEYSRIKGFF